MKFFKHFTDAHRGQTMTILMDRLGHMGVACYWILVEMCAEKLEKEESETYTDAHCKFQFHEKILRQNLRISRTNLRKFLDNCAEISALSSDLSEDVFEIEMPKLLECLDRDSRRARTERGPPAPKIKSKRKKEIAYANLNWRKEAAKVAEMIKRYGDWRRDRAEVLDELGETTFDLATRAGVHKMRMLPGNQYLVTNIAGMLKDANDQLKLKEAL